MLRLPKSVTAGNCPKWIVSLVVFACCSARSDAAVPLVEFSYEKTPQFGGEGNPPVRDWEFAFSAYAGPTGNPTFFEWLDFYGTDDVGKTFPAPVAIVQGARSALASPATIYQMSSAGLSNTMVGRLVDWSASSCNPCADVLVQKLSAYQITEVERTIDQLIVQTTGFSTWVVGGKQTVRYLGERVPEPNSGFLILSAILLPIFIRRKHIASYISCQVDTSGCR
jgi:hypothetical protein